MRHSKSYSYRVDKIRGRTKDNLLSYFLDQYAGKDIHDCCKPLKTKERLTEQKSQVAEAQRRITFITFETL